MKIAVSRFLRLSLIGFMVALHGCGGGGGGEGDTAATPDYGVPAGLDLSANCPSNGTWVANNARRAFITPPALSIGKLIVNDWRVDIHPVTWENTGICTTINFGGSWVACDYLPVFTGQILRGYIDPTHEYHDANNNIMYAGVTTGGQELRFWDYPVPVNVYLNIDFNKNNQWTQESLTPQ